VIAAVNGLRCVVSLALACDMIIAVKDADEHCVYRHGLARRGTQFVKTFTNACEYI
jgi:hypothetical protein